MSSVPGVSLHLVKLLYIFIHTRPESRDVYFSSSRVSFVLSSSSSSSSVTRDRTSRHTDGGYDWGLTDKCGQCYEVVCIDGQTRGKQWSDLGPWGGCQEAGKKSVTVMISDSCPCHHPNTGNKRWCCGDRTHLDLSYAAFDSIAVRHRGVVDLKVRPADCSKQGTVAYYQ